MDTRSPKHNSINGRATFWAIFLLFSFQIPCFAETSSLFSTSENCSFCHSADFGALVDSKGNNLSIYHDWESTMMGNSFRDPLFRAKLESEKNRNQSLTAVIEDKCLTCHTPMARTQALWDGGERYSLSEAEQNSLAQDGVSCTLCHQIQPESLGSVESFSGNYMIKDRREIYGPYSNVLLGPMRNHVNYSPVYGSHVGESALCATCHTLFTPYVDDTGKIAGEFPEQTPYLEWLNSSYASGTSPRSCQDCHMPRIDEQIKITNRPPWFNGTHSPFWKHHFTGGNRFMLEMLLANGDKLDVTASNDQFRTTIERTNTRLTQEAAEVSIEVVGRTQNLLRLKVKVINKTGHKFPSGFPTRRAWLRLQVRDNKDTIVFESGNWSNSGEISGLDEGFEPHHEVITSPDQVQIYQAIMGDINDTVTYTLLRAAKYLKDNRLLPHGYTASGPMTQYTAIAGDVVSDNNFNREAGHEEGTGTDLVTYEIPLNSVAFPLSSESQLLYQTVSPRFVDDLKEENTPVISQFAQMYEAMDRRPIVIDAKTLLIE